jgi:DNA-binding CsgD family transcriptional regulator
MLAKKTIFSTSEAAFAVDHNGQIVVWNEAGEQTFGYTESEALGQSCWELLSGRDIFGNRSCCEGCPLRATAFNNDPVNRFQLDYKTAAHELKRFTVSMLMLFDGPGKEVLVHLCRPDLDANQNAVTNRATNNSAVSNQRGSLTPRETEVLALLHQGKAPPEIAAAMGISVTTVRNHIQHVLVKLHVHSRLEAVALGRKLGLI